MHMQKNFDGSLRAELLCFLTVGQLVGYARTGEWPKTVHAIEAARIWTASHEQCCDWYERLRMIDASRILAPRIHLGIIAAHELPPRRVFADRWQLDYGDPAVRLVHATCMAFLAGEPKSRRTH